MATRLGQMLVEAKLISSEQLKQALELQSREGGRIGTNMVKLGQVTEERLAAFLSKQYGIPSIDLANFEIDSNLVKLIPSEVAQKHMIVPVSRRGRR